MGRQDLRWTLRYPSRVPSRVPSNEGVGPILPADFGCGVGTGNAQSFSFGNMSFPRNVPNLNSCAGNPTVGQNPSQNFCGSFQQNCGQVPNFQSNSCAGCLAGNNGRTGCEPSFSRMPPGGLTPQASNIWQIAELVQTLDGNQTRVLRDMLSDRMGQQSRMVPEFFGDVPRTSGFPFVSDASQGPLLTEQTGNGSQGGLGLDIFSKSEKWLSPAPVPPVDTWRNRESEILGWADYGSQLVAWAAQASEIFASEISQATRWATPIVWDTLSRPQKSRSSRLFAILKAAFSSHPRTSMLISVFSEGMPLQGFGSGMMQIEKLMQTDLNWFANSPWSLA